MSNYSTIKYNDCTNGNGICVSVWFSGCQWLCKNCHNPKEQNPCYGQEFTQETIEKIIYALGANGVKRSLSILGGEPLMSYNVCSVAELIFQVRKKLPKTKIFLWSGYTLQEIENSVDILGENAPRNYDYVLKNIDYLIDGRYVEEKRNIMLALRGSSNQKIYHRVEENYTDITEQVDAGKYQF